MARYRSDAIIRLIGAFKLLKAALLIAIGVGALTMRDGGAGDHLSRWIYAIGVDPHGKHLGKLLERISSLDARTFAEIGIGSLLYSVVFVIEGVGLIMRKPWAEVMTVIVTLSFIPLEIHEMIEHESIPKAIVIVVNVLVVIYLLRRLKREKHWPFHKERLVTPLAPPPS